MKAAILCLTILLAALSAAQVTLTGKSGPNTITVTYDRTQDREGIHETITWKEQRPDGRSLTKFYKALYSTAGAPIWKSYDTDEGRGKWTATITPTGAEVVRTEVVRVAERPRQIPLPAGGSVADPSIVWFIGKKPEKNEIISFMSLDLERKYWQQMIVTCQGPAEQTIDGKTYSGWAITRKGARSTVMLLVDEKGMPLVWQQGTIKLVRS